MTQATPRWGNIPKAVGRSGVSRASLYLWAQKHPGLFRKNGRSTLVDLEMLDELVAALPVAKLRLPKEQVA